MARNVFGILDDISSSVSELRDALAPLASIASGSIRSPKRKRAASMPARPAGKKRARRKAVSAATKAKRILQGRYLAAIRPLTKAQRAKVRKIQAKKGHEAAIRAAKNLAR
jgi:hypothetical protein